MVWKWGRRVDADPCSSAHLVRNSRHCSEIVWMPCEAGGQPILVVSGDGPGRSITTRRRRCVGRRRPHDDDARRHGRGRHRSGRAGDRRGRRPDPAGFDPARGRERAGRFGALHRVGRSRPWDRSGHPPAPARRSWRRIDPSPGAWPIPDRSGSAVVRHGTGRGAGRTGRVRARGRRHGDRAPGRRRAAGGGWTHDRRADVVDRAAIS